MSTGRLPYAPARRRVHWTTVDAVEKLAFDTGAELEAGVDSTGEFVAVVTDEGTEYRGRMTATVDGAAS